MPLDIEGWVEMTRFGAAERAEEFAWSGVIRLSCLIDTADEVSEALFGLWKRALMGDDLGFRPLAQARGIPTNPSGEVKADLEWIKGHEASFRTGEFLGFSYVEYEELRDLDWASYGVGSLEASDWALVFRLIEDIRMCGRFGEPEFRIVCWGSW